MRDIFAVRNRKSIPVLLGVFILSICALAQELPTGKPESLGLSPERLERIAATVQRDIDDKRIAGAVTLIVRHGHVAWFKSQGMMDREAAKPMQPDAMFRICSMTKPITSVAVMMLYEEGRFLLDDPISKYLPEFKDPKVFVKPANSAPYSIPATKEITIRDLLRHTSGLTYNWNDDLGPLYEKAGIASGLLPYDGTIGDNVKKLATIPLLFNPGDRFEYGLSLDVLGRLVEVVSGKPLDEFFRTRIFEPLGMKDTYFYPPDNKLDRLATAYTYYPDKGLNRFPETPIKEGNFSYSADYPSRGPKKLFSGGAGLVSTAMDYARFCQMMLDGGKVGNTRLLSRKTVELMTHDQLGKIGPDQGFGLGFGVEGVKSPLAELGSPGEFTWGGFFYTGFTVDPKEQMIVIFMAQLHPTGDLTLDREVNVLAYQAISD
ncbi:MAG TPA: serine hydrolase domain-containing protein [Candidatus Sulfotelmatobacter sp.]|jgi:CubicO group peptidase (beta-lactamase class C family)|nr:serine hydrolase domain-containing protein [Candidatus Sulfotelmatobacter sp.]